MVTKGLEVPANTSRNVWVVKPGRGSQRFLRFEGCRIAREKVDCRGMVLALEFGGDDSE
jgi:hypothetical protein